MWTPFDSEMVDVFGMLSLEKAPHDAPTMLAPAHCPNSPTKKNNARKGLPQAAGHSQHNAELANQAEKPDRPGKLDKADKPDKVDKPFQTKPPKSSAPKFPLTKNNRPRRPLCLDYVNGNCSKLRPYCRSELGKALGGESQPG